MHIFIKIALEFYVETRKFVAHRVYYKNAIPPMLVFIICLACFYIVSVAFVLVAIRKASFGFEDENGFHFLGAERSEPCEIGAGNPATDHESKEVASPSVTLEPLMEPLRNLGNLRNWRKTSRIRRRNSVGSSRKKTLVRAA